MKQLNNESDLSDAYNYWIDSKIMNWGNEHIRFGQYIFNEYNFEYGNSYNIRDNVGAFLLIAEGLSERDKGKDDESE